MKVLWLNDSLVLRSENKEEKSALAVLHTALGPEPETDTTDNFEYSNRTQFVE